MWFSCFKYDMKIYFLRSYLFARTTQASLNMTILRLNILGSINLSCC